MALLNDKEITEKKRLIFEEVMQKLEHLKFEELKTFRNSEEVDEKIRIEQFNYEINDMKSVLQVAYECLYSSK